MRLNWQFNLEEYSSFRQFRSQICTNIQTNLTRCHASPNITERLIARLFSDPPVVSFLAGEGRLYQYVYPGGEKKIFGIWNDPYHSTLDEWWFKYYSFMHHEFGKYTVSNSCFTRGGVLTGSHSFLSHNEHFGHFVGDDLPGFLFWDVAFGPDLPRMLCCSTTKESLVHEWQSIPTSDTHIHRLEDMKALLL